MNRALEEDPKRPREIVDVPHCSDVSAEDAHRDGACTVLWPLWVIGDIVEKVECGQIRRLKVIEVRWDQLWLGAQTLVLSDLHTPSRYVGCDPFALRPLSSGLTLTDIITQKQVEHGSATAKQHEVGHWRDQKTSFARKNWQRVKREAGAAWNDLHNLRTNKPVILALPAPKDWQPETKTVEAGQSLLF